MCVSSDGVFFCSSRRRHTICALGTGVQTCALPFCGSIHVAGLDFAAMDEDDLARARRGRIGIVLQAFHLLPTMTALENVAVPLELAGIADPFGRAAAELEAVGLGHRLTPYPAQLSGGEQQRVAIARAMAGGPAIIFADEPTGNLDPATGHATIELIFARRAALGDRKSTRL